MKTVVLTLSPPPGGRLWRPPDQGLVFEHRSGTWLAGRRPAGHHAVAPLDCGTMGGAGPITWGGCLPWRRSPGSGGPLDADVRPWRVPRSGAQEASSSHLLRSNPERYARWSNDVGWIGRSSVTSYDATRVGGSEDMARKIARNITCMVSRRLAR